MPALVEEPHDLPAGLVGIGKLVKGFPGQGQLGREGVLGEESVGWCDDWCGSRTCAPRCARFRGNAAADITA
jgi:hypothetical protein